VARSHTIVVDGATYQWTETTSGDLNPEGSTSFAYRFDFDSIVEIRDDRGSEIRFETPLGNPQLRPGWWNSEPRVTAAVVARAIEIARRKPRPRSYTLTRIEAAEALRGPVATLEDELTALGAALAALPASSDAFVKSVLAIGCRYREPDEPLDLAIADWIASHANELAAARDVVQRIFETRRDVCTTRTALAFLIDLCESMNVHLGLDPAPIDAKLPPPSQCRPWGVPPSHTWWRPPDDSDDDD
jgi:hypothetical protein